MRLHALAVLRDKVEMRWLSISQRVHLLKGALLDRDKTAAACAEELVAGWLRKARSSHAHHGTMLTMRAWPSPC